MRRKKWGGTPLIFRLKKAILENFWFFFCWIPKNGDFCQFWAKFFEIGPENYEKKFLEAWYPLGTPQTTYILPINAIVGLKKILVMGKVAIFSARDKK